MDNAKATCDTHQALKAAQKRPHALAKGLASSGTAKLTLLVVFYLQA
jgi:hypothetical protein